MIDTLYQNAELAIAAYATLGQGPTSDQLQNLRAQGFSEKQSTEFVIRFSTVVTQYNDTDTSFSATVFKDATGNLTLAIRGTQEAGDFVPTDQDIWQRGAGYDQIVAMYNWWQRETTSAGQRVQQYEVRSVLDGIDPVPAGAVLLYKAGGGGPLGLERAYYLVETAEVAATGGLADLANEPLAVTGHSLGGHLAMAFGILFAQNIAEMTVFNAPGFIDRSMAA